MSECFTGKGLTVRWTTEELGILYHACATLGASRWELLEERGVLSWLNKERQDRTAGQMAFSFDVPPPDLAGPEARRFLASLIESVARELAMPEPDPVALGRNWTREERMHWLARLGEMYEMMKRTSRELQLPEYTLLLSAPDEAEIQIFLYLGYLEELYRLPEAKADDKLAFIDTILTMIAEAGIERQKVALLAKLRGDRDRIVESLGLNQHRRLTDKQTLGRRAQDYEP